jgi:hypothetical protein
MVVDTLEKLQAPSDENRRDTLIALKYLMAISGNPQLSFMDFDRMISLTEQVGLQREYVLKLDFKDRSRLCSKSFYPRTVRNSSNLGSTTKNLRESQYTKISSGHCRCFSRNYTHTC